MEQVVPLRLNDHFEPTVQLRIMEKGRLYAGELLTGLGRWYGFDIPLTSTDIVDINRDLRKILEQHSMVFERANSQKEAKEAALAALRDEGKVVFHRVFKDAGARERIRKVLHSGGSIQITAAAKDFFLPWELLYDPALGNHQLPGFWGFHYVIARALILDFDSDDPPPIIRTSRPHIGVVADQSLEHVKSSEIPFLERLQQERRASITLLRPLKDTLRRDELKEFGRFLKAGMDIFHSACHSGSEDNAPFLRLSDSFQINMKDFHGEEYMLSRNPLVVLNACRSGTIDPSRTANWASLFCECGARGVIATEFCVPDRFAAVFAKRLYHYLLNSEPVGVALLQTRQHYWSQDNNPLGLGYALYASPSIKILIEQESLT